jgi:superfamily II DNA/RNA helicase
VVKSHPGAGKTLAYLLPMLMRVYGHVTTGIGPAAVILMQTNESVWTVYDTIK